MTIWKLINNYLESGKWLTTSILGKNKDEPWSLTSTKDLEWSDGQWSLSDRSRSTKNTFLLVDLLTAVTMTALKKLSSIGNSANLNFKKSLYVKLLTIFFKIIRSLLSSEATRKEKEKNKIILKLITLTNDWLIFYF